MHDCAWRFAESLFTGPSPRTAKERTRTRSESGRRSREARNARTISSPMDWRRDDTRAVRLDAPADAKDHSQQRTFRTVTTSSLPSSKPDLICSWRHIALAGLVVNNGHGEAIKSSTCLGSQLVVKGQLQVVLSVARIVHERHLGWGDEGSEPGGVSRWAGLPQQIKEDAQSRRR